MSTVRALRILLFFILSLFFSLFTAAQEGNKPKLLFFTAAWCAPCQKIKPLVSDLAKRYGAELVLIDIDRSPGAREDFNVSGLPTIIVLDSNGQLRFRAQGANKQTLDSLTSALKSLAASGAHSRKQG